MIGQTVAGRYTLVEELFSNKLFDVYRAEDITGGRNVKVRLVRPSAAADTGFLKELKDAAEHHREFQHPALERVLDVVEDDGLTFITSEFEAGSILEERLKRLKSFSVPVALSLAISIAEAVEACHSAGMIHGDISARTILTKNSEGVKLLEAGYWRAYGQSELAAKAMIPEMAPYLAPEITSGEMPNVATDVYALGVLLYRLLSGRYPYQGDNPNTIAAKHRTAPYPSLRTSNPSVPDPLDKVIAKAMSKEPIQRYSSVKKMLRDLRLIQDALRFGKSLTWPLDPSEPVPEQPIVPESAASEKKPKDQAKAKPGTARKKKSGRSRSSGDGVPSWLVGLTIVASVIGVLAIVVIIVLNLSSPKELTVPNLVGKSFTEAQSDLKEINVTLRRLKSEPSDEFPEGTVLALDPSPGATVKEGWIVDAIVSSGSRFVEVPDLRGRTVDEAKSLLETLNLELDDDFAYEQDRNMEPGLIKSQVPEPRRQIERGSRIKVTITTEQRVRTEPSRTLHTFTIRVQVPDSLEGPVRVLVTMTDDEGTRTIDDQERNPGALYEISADGLGNEANFRIFFNGDLHEQKIVRASSDEEGP